MAVARRNGRDKVGSIILGRGEDDQKMREWLATAALVPGFIGFAVGRTAFWQPLVDFRARKLTRDAAVAEIAGRYREFVRIFDERSYWYPRCVNSTTKRRTLRSGERFFKKECLCN